jgi:hypothetical protein
MSHTLHAWVSPSCTTRSDASPAAAAAAVGVSARCLEPGLRLHRHWVSSLMHHQ